VLNGDKIVCTSLLLDVNSLADSFKCDELSLPTIKDIGIAFLCNSCPEVLYCLITHFVIN